MSGEEVETEEIILVNPDQSQHQLSTDANGNLKVAIASAGVLNNLAQNQILSDATPFAGANVAAIKAKTDLIPADATTQLDTTVPAIKAKTDLIPADITAALDTTVPAIKSKTDLLTAILGAVGGPYADSATNILLARDAVISCPDNPSPGVKVAEFNVGYFKGTIRINFDLKAPAGTHWVVGQLYQNGVAVGAAEGQNNTAFVTYSQQIAVNVSDVISLYAFNSDAGYPGQIQHFRIMGLFPIPQVPAVTV